jgi:hypothetical protein
MWCQGAPVPAQCPKTEARAAIVEWLEVDEAAFGVEA